MKSRTAQMREDLRRNELEEKSTLEEIGASVNTKYIEGVGYNLSLQNKQWESEPVEFNLSTKGQSELKVLYSMLNDWNNGGKKPRLDIIKHPISKNDVVVKMSMQKKTYADKKYYGECDAGYIQCFRDEAQVFGVWKSREKDMQEMLKILRVSLRLDHATN